MARLNRYVSGTGYYVTDLFADGGQIKKVTYQVHPKAEGILAEYGIRSGDQIPRKLFFNLVEQHLLYTHGGGPGEESAPESGSFTTPDRVDRAERTQIPAK